VILTCRLSVCLSVPMTICKYEWMDCASLSPERWIFGTQEFTCHRSVPDAKEYSGFKSRVRFRWVTNQNGDLLENSSNNCRKCPSINLRRWCLQNINCRRTGGTRAKCRFCRNLLYQTDFFVVPYSATKNDLPSNNRYHFIR
jgi:hypothetical protein